MAPAKIYLSEAAKARATRAGGNQRVVKAVGATKGRTGSKAQLTQQKAANTRKILPIKKTAVKAPAAPVGKAVNTARASRAAARNTNRTKVPVAKPPAKAKQLPAPKPVSAPAPKKQPAPVKSVSTITLALQTANSIAVNRAHPRQTDVIELLRTREKGWIDDKRFQDLLKSLVL